MTRYKKGRLFIAFLASILLAAGCGDGGYDTESRLSVTAVSPGTVESDIVETTDDYGTDGVASTNDPDGSEGNNRPDPGEAITVPLENDTLTVTFANTIREGSEEGTPIRVNEYVITYYDSNGLTPAFATQKNNFMTVIVDPGSTTTFDFPIVDLAMKQGTVGVLGVRDVFLYWNQTFDNTLYAQIDFYGRDIVNNEPAVAVARVTIIFDNY